MRIEVENDVETKLTNLDKEIGVTDGTLN